MNFNSMSELEKEKALIPYILQTLQEFGGQAERSAIKEKIISSNDDIADFANKKDISKKTGNEYSKFAFRFNFAIKNLMLADFLKYTKGDSLVTLTDKGMNVNVSTLDLEKEIYKISNKYWDEKREENKIKKNSAIKSFQVNGEKSKDVSDEEQYMETFKEKLLDSIANMSPKKFEMFSRMLLNKMGVDFDKTKGVQVSNDGGIDGYGYHRDLDDFRTTRVVIQCKRYNSNDVGSPEIDRFLGAMNKFQADYGIFITNSRYTVAAQEASRAGTPITLIDGNDLVRLVIKYQLHIKPIQTYELLDFYNDED